MTLTNELFGLLVSASESRYRDRPQTYLHSLRPGTSVIRIPVGSRLFSPLQNVENCSRVHAALVLCVPTFFLWVNRPWHEANHSLPSRAEIKNEWSYTSTPPVCLHELTEENCTFTCTLNFYELLYYS